MLEVGETVDPLLEDRSEAPTWAYELARDLSLETLWLLDGVIHYVAEVILRNVPGTRWGLGRGMHDSAAVGKPVLEYADSEFGPVDSLLVLLHSALHYPGFPPGAPRDAPDTLYRLFEDVRAAHERGLRFPT